MVCVRTHYVYLASGKRAHCPQTNTRDKHISTETNEVQTYMAYIYGLRGHRIMTRKLSHLICSAVTCSRDTDISM